MPRIQSGFTPVLETHDFEGHRMILKEEKLGGNCQVFIQLKGDSRQRLIGEVDRKRKIMIVKRDHRKHYHILMKGYGFNWVIINQRVPVEYNQILVIERDDDGMDYYLFPINVITLFGTKKNFGRSGFELQYFLPWVKMREYKKSGVHYIKGALVGDV